MVKIPAPLRSWIIVALAILAWSSILLIFLVPTAHASECRNRADWRESLPPAQYQHEPSRSFLWADADVLNAMHGVTEPNRHSYGHYGERSGLIFICKGLTGRALWATRMHEEAHAMGWRH